MECYQCYNATFRGKSSTYREHLRKRSYARCVFCYSQRRRSAPGLSRRGHDVPLRDTSV